MDTEDNDDDHRRARKLEIAAAIESLIGTQGLTEAQAAKIVGLTPQDLRDVLHDAIGCPKIVLWHAWIELLKRVGEKPSDG
jgi:hypothetical protein